MKSRRVFGKKIKRKKITTISRTGKSPHRKCLAMKMLNFKNTEQSIKASAKIDATGLFR